MKPTTKVDDLSDMSEKEARSILGEKINSVESSEYKLELKFVSGKRLIVTGSTFGGCALNVYVEKD